VRHRYAIGRIETNLKDAIIDSQCC
jgi:hypothetical protein